MNAQTNSITHEDTSNTMADEDYAMLNENDKQLLRDLDMYCPW